MAPIPSCNTCAFPRGFLNLLQYVERTEKGVDGIQMPLINMVSAGWFAVASGTTKAVETANPVPLDDTRKLGFGRVALSGEPRIV